MEIAETRPVTFVISAGAYYRDDLCKAIDTLRNYFIKEFRAIDIIMNRCMLFAEFSYQLVSVGTKGFITALGFKNELMIMLTIIDPAYPFLDQATLLGHLNSIIENILLKALRETNIASKNNVFIVDARYLDYPLRLVDAYHVGIRNLVEHYR